MLQSYEGNVKLMLSYQGIEYIVLRIEIAQY